jgi:hypothetical protein
MGGHCVLRLALIFLCGGVFQIFDLKNLIANFLFHFFLQKKIGQIFERTLF